NLANEVGLAYDFDANVGDTLLIDNPFAFYPFQAEVIEIDSIYIEPANEYRKRIKLLGPYGFVPEYWIEGIGSNAGIVYSGCQMGQLTGSAMYTLLCYYESDELIYKNQYFPLCFYPIVNIEKIIDETYNFFVFPNPVSGISQLSIQYPENRKLKIIIFNSTGNIVNEFKASSPGEVKIDSDDYPKGIYFYQVYDENKSIFSDKFIVL
ncbi:MAG: T9SS type A sorting domain-containing protein, partial [Bacteroidales bacterium]|nr:T9SS type A sorting domain-containing protein [Bacteroidales bacterium]